MMETKQKNIYITVVSLLMDTSLRQTHHLNRHLEFVPFLRFSLHLTLSKLNITSHVHLIEMSTSHDHLNPIYTH